MRDMEKSFGPIRIGIIYLLSGFAGNLLSCIFIPHVAGVGPNGCHFGLLGALVMEVINSWEMLKKPGLQLVKLLGFALVLLIIGLLPWFDNYAQLGGFIMGIVSAGALFPYVSFGQNARTRYFITTVISLVLMVAMFTVLIILVYVKPIEDCEWCKWFNCVPWTSKFCEQNSFFYPRGKAGLDALA